jgi:hypothetical protein
VLAQQPAEIVPRVDARFEMAIGVRKKLVWIFHKVISSPAPAIEMLIFWIVSTGRFFGQFDNSFMRCSRNL